MLQYTDSISLAQVAACDAFLSSPMPNRHVASTALMADAFIVDLLEL